MKIRFSAAALFSHLAALVLITGCGESDNERAMNQAAPDRDGKAGMPADPAAEAASLGDLEVRDGKLYQSGAPYSGTLREEHGNGKGKLQVKVTNGSPDGIMKIWDAGGQKRLQTRFTNGRPGRMVLWDLNGNPLPQNSRGTTTAEAEWNLTDAFRNIAGDPSGALADFFLPRVPGGAPGAPPADDRRPADVIDDPPPRSEQPILTLHPAEVRERSGEFFVAETGELFTGRVVAEYSDGSSYVWHFEDGLRHGSFTSYYGNGRKQVEEFFSSGRKEGSYTSWFENGQRRMETSVKGGHQQGLHQEWTPDGVLIARWNYTADGQILNELDGE